MSDGHRRLCRHLHRRRDHAQQQQGDLSPRRQQAEQAADREFLQTVDGLRWADERRIADLYPNPTVILSVLAKDLGTEETLPSTRDPSRSTAQDDERLS